MKTTFCITVLLAIVLVTIDAQVQLGDVYSNGKSMQQDNKELWKLKEQGTQQDSKDAIYWYKKAAEQGKVEAQLKLGDIYANGQGVQQDSKEAEYWYEKAANQGNAEAQYKLADIYANGKGVEQDYAKAIEWYEKATEQGNAEAQLKLEEARRKLEEAQRSITDNSSKQPENTENELQKQKEAEAQYVLGMEYYIQRNYKKACECFEKAANEEYAKAQYMLVRTRRKIEEEKGNITDKPSKPSKQPKITEDELKKQREAKDQYESGMEYYNRKKYKEACKCFEKAANEGYAKAQYMLGIMYLKGESVRKDCTKTIYWYRKAANQGYDKAQYELGVMYLNGKGVRRDYKEAFNWLGQAKDLENKDAEKILKKKFESLCQYYSKMPDYDWYVEWINSSKSEQYQLEKQYARKGKKQAQCNVGIMYYKGDSVAKSYSTAIKWFKSAANQDDEKAQYCLGIMYLLGQGVRGNFAEAFKWFKKSANQDYLPAQCNLGLMYALGQGVEQDYAKAIELLEQSANPGWKRKEKESAIAQYNLGLMYALGQGVKQNIQTAIEWFEKAKDLDNIDSKKMLQELGITSNN